MIKESVMSGFEDQTTRSPRNWSWIDCVLRSGSVADLEAEPGQARHCHQQHRESFTECVLHFALALSDQRTVTPIQPLPVASCNWLAVLTLAIVVAFVGMEAPRNCRSGLKYVPKGDLLKSSPQFLIT